MMLISILNAACTMVTGNTQQFLKSVLLTGTLNHEWTAHVLVQPILHTHVHVLTQSGLYWCVDQSGHLLTVSDAHSRTLFNVSLTRSLNSC